MLRPKLIGASGRWAIPAHISELSAKNHVAERAGSYIYGTGVVWPWLFFRTLTDSGGSDGLEQEQIQTEGQPHGFNRPGSHGPIDGKQDVVNGGGVEVGRGGLAAPADQPEAARECVDGLGGAVAAGAAQLNEIVGGGKSEHEAPAV